MELHDAISQVNSIFIDVLENDDIKIAAETTADDVPEWDSLNHIQLVVSIEKHFNLRFTSSEIQSFKNIGEMCEAIAKKS
jgi:acyl carrier protein